MRVWSRHRAEALVWFLSLIQVAHKFILAIGDERNPFEENAVLKALPGGACVVFDAVRQLFSCQVGASCHIILHKIN